MPSLTPYFQDSTGVLHLHALGVYDILYLAFLLSDMILTRLPSLNLLEVLYSTFSHCCVNGVLFTTLPGKVIMFHANYFQD